LRRYAALASALRSKRSRLVCHHRHYAALDKGIERDAAHTQQRINRSPTAAKRGLRGVTFTP
jgi:hypothetical protein